MSLHCVGPGVILNFQNIFRHFGIYISSTINEWKREGRKQPFELKIHPSSSATVPHPRSLGKGLKVGQGSRKLRKWDFNEQIIWDIINEQRYFVQL